MINILINGKETKATDVTWAQNAKKEREFGSLTVKNDRKSRYEKYTLVQMSPLDESLQYVVQHDMPTKISENYYEHQITLTEPMAIFDTVYPASRSHYPRTGEQMTLRDVLTIYQRELAFYHRINLRWEGGTWLDKKLTTREYDSLNMSNILTDLFRSLKANPKCYYEDGGWYIYPQYYSTRNDRVNIKAEAEASELNNIDYATKARVNAQNAIYEDQEILAYPSPNGYILPRSENIGYADSEARYELDSDTVAITKVILKLQLFDEEDTSRKAHVDVDITPHVLKQEAYDSLKRVRYTDRLDSINKLNCIVYDTDNNVIKGLYSTKEFLGLTSDIKRAYNAGEYQWQQDPVEPEEDGVWFPDDSVDVKDIPIRVEYIRQRNFSFTVQRHNSNGMNMSTQLYNQSASRVEVSRLKSNMGNLANRMGNPKKTVTKTFRENETPYKVFDYNADGEVITEAKYTQTGKDIFAEYVLSKNFAAIEADESITREPSPYTITGKKLQTNVVEESYIVFSDEKQSVQSILTDKAIDVIMDTFADDPRTDGVIEFGAYQARFPDHDESKVIHAPTFYGGDGYTSTFNILFRRPIVAGFSIEEDDDGIFKEPIVYTYEGPTFYLEDFYLTLSQGIEVEDDGEYPLIDDTEEIDDKALVSRRMKPIDLGLNDNLAYTFALHAMTDTDDIIVGERFQYLNPLHNPQDRTLKLYKSDSPYSLGEERIRSNDSEVDNGEIIVNNSERKIDVIGDENFDYWAIADDEDYILLASNGPKTVYVNFLLVDPTAAIVTIYVTYKDFESTLHLSSDVSYTTIKLRKISASANPELSISSSVDYIARKLNSISTEVNSGFVMSSEVTYNTTKPRHISFEPKANLGLSTDASYTVIKPRYLTESLTSNLGLSVSVSYTKDETEYADEWSYLGTSGTEDGSVNAGSEESCRSSSEIKSWLDNNEPASDYAIGFVIKVNHGYYENQDNFGACTEYYYEAIKN